MPDQSSAAREHALLQEITAPLDSLPEDPVQFSADVEFPVVLRGYDRIAVDAYVRRTSQMVAELQARTSPQAAIRRALERVGEEVSGILQRAHQTAEEITAQSRRDAEDRLDVARAEAERITAEAQRRVSELDADADRVWEERERILADVRDLSRQLGELADAAAARFAPAGEEAAETPTVDGATEATEALDGADEAEETQAFTAVDELAIAEPLDQEPGSTEPLDQEPGSTEPPDREPGPTEPLDQEPGEDQGELAWAAGEEPIGPPTVAIEPPPAEPPVDDDGVAPPGPSAVRAPFDFESDGDTLPGLAERPGESITARHNLGSPRP
jgi:DivIVA domain-containing protein